MYVSERFSRRAALVAFLIVSLVLAACGTQVANSNWPAATADGDIVYVAYGPGVMAVDVVEEDLLWSYPEEANQALQFYAAPSVEDGRVVFGDYGRSGGFFSPASIVSIYAVDDQSAPDTEWVQSEVAKDRIIAPPLQVGGTVYVGTADNHVVALNGGDGRFIWDFETDHSIWGQPTYADGVVYATSLDKEVYALDAESGAELWHRKLQGAVAGEATQDTDLVYVGSFDEKISALDKDSGEVRWTAPASAAVWAAPEYFEGVVYYADINGNIYAVRANSGEALWSVSVGEYVTASPRVFGNTLYVATAGDPSVEPEGRTGSLLALSLEDGDDVFGPVSLDGPAHSTPVLTSRGVVVVAQTETSLVKLTVHDFEDGAVVYEFEPPAE